MKRSSYGKHDYAFGQMMLTLRTNIGLTQAGLAELLGVSRRAVSEWEAGSTYPKAGHLKAFMGYGKDSFLGQPFGPLKSQILVVFNDVQ